MVLILLLVGTNAGRMIYESQFTDVSLTQEVDTGEGDAAVFGGGIGDVNYGESTSDN